MTTRVVLQTMAGGGSGHGISFWKMWMGCTLKAQKMEELIKQIRAGKVKPSKEARKALVTGTVFHGFAELYYKLAMKGRLKQALKIDTMAVQYVDDCGDPYDVGEAGRMEGETLFRAYRSVFPPNELGEIVGVEEQLEGHDIDDALQCFPFTAKPDLAIRLDKSDLKRIARSRGLMLRDLSKGYWLADWKTVAERDWTNLMYEKEVQFPAYLRAYQARYPRREVKGMLVNMILKTKRPSFRTLVVRYPSRAENIVVDSFLFQAQERRDLAMELGSRANITQCFPYGGSPCDFIKSCTRAA